MSLFSEMAALKAALQLRGVAKVTFHLRFRYINSFGRETVSGCGVIVGWNTPFRDFLRIYCEARSYFECQLPPNARMRRAYRHLFLKHFRRNMFSDMNLTRCFGELVIDRRLACGDCISLVYDLMSPTFEIPKTSKMVADARLCLPSWEIGPYCLDNQSWLSEEDALKASQHKLP